MLYWIKHTMTENSWKEKFIKVSDMNIRYLTAGSGFSCILVHGWPLSFELPFPFLDLGKDYFKIIAVDLPGFGSSDRPNFKVSVKNYANFLTEFSKVLELAEHAIVGWSLGGMIAIKYTAINHRKIKALVICGTAAVGKQAATRTIRTIYRFLSFSVKNILPIKNLLQKAVSSDKLILELWKKVTPPSNFNSAEEDPSIRHLRNLPITFSKEILDAGFRADLTKECKSLKGISTLILAGEKDNLMTVSCSEKIDNLIGNSKFLIVPRAEHWNILNDNSNQLIIDFIKGRVS
ncbi:alpha/beta hydrolase [Patescibacteria group bacterium]|nr:alpha/beta hydrolase [Patescibacteria group bacterium]